MPAEFSDRTGATEGSLVYKCPLQLRRSTPQAKLVSTVSRNCDICNQGNLQFLSRNAERVSRTEFEELIVELVEDQRTPLESGSSHGVAGQVSLFVLNWKLLVGSELDGGIAKRHRLEDEMRVDVQNELVAETDPGVVSAQRITCCRVAPEMVQL